jgi:DNA excision repair protein ERCC-2
MPTGTGKTVCVLSLVTSYQHAHPETGKLIYCTRTVPEMTKCMAELKQVIGYRDRELGRADARNACLDQEPSDQLQAAAEAADATAAGVTTANRATAEVGSTFLALCLSSRRNMCIHPEVMAADSDREAVDALCRDRTASWVRAKAAASPGSVDTCSFYEEYATHGSDSVVPSGIYGLDDLKELGQQRGWCPYFLARHVINQAKVLVYNYQYMLDPKVSKMVSSELEADSVVVFDEAHNIDNVCIEALSVSLDSNSLDQSAASVGELSQKVREMEQQNNTRLNDEYRRLCNSLGGGGNGDSNGDRNATDTILANPTLPSDVLEEQMPGTIRKAKHFVAALNNVVQYLRAKLAALRGDADTETPSLFMIRLEDKCSLDSRTLKFTYTRLNSLLRTLEVTNLDEYNALQDVADFVTLVATYTEGFSIVLERNGSVIPGVYEPVMQLACNDASLAIAPVFKRFGSVIITSGTLSPLDLYPKLLDFNPVVRIALDMSTFRPCILPIVVTKGSDQGQLSTRYELRDDDSVTRNYGELLVELAATVPDGIVCFFTSYMYMEKVVERWHASGALQQLLRRKLVFIETKDVVETTLALNNFKRACDCGRGAVFLSVARGKVAEGIDFDRHYGRCVVLMGVPYQYTLSYVLRERLEYLRAKFQIRPEDFLTFDALRQAAQCVGRVIRSKNDYGVMIFADSRYNRHDKRSKLPKWIQQFLPPANLNASTGSTVDMVRSFLREMAQPVDPVAMRSILLDEATIGRSNGTRSGKEPAVDKAAAGGGAASIGVVQSGAPTTVSTTTTTSSAIGMVAAAETVVASSSSAEPIEVERGGVMNGNASDERAKRPRFEYLE